MPLTIPFSPGQADAMQATHGNDFRHRGTAALNGARWMAAFCAGVALAGPGRADPRRPVRGEAESSLVALDLRDGWGAGVSLQADRRAFLVKNAPEGRLDLDLRRVLARLEAPVHPALRIAGEAGWIRAERDFEDAQGGLVWGIGAELQAAEIVLRESRVFGRTEMVGFGVEASLRRARSDFTAADLAWWEQTVQPFVRYERDDRSRRPGRLYQPLGVAMRAGLAWTGVQGTFGRHDLKAHRDFGLALGSDIRWASGWSTRLRAVFYTEKDRELSLGAVVRF